MRLLPLSPVFQPPSDSWMLVSQLRRERPNPGARALDLCTGSGVLAIAAAQAGYAAVLAVDISGAAVAAARLNARLNGARIEARHGDLFSAVPGQRFDLIVANPPYVPSPAMLPRRGLERAWEAGEDGRVFLDQICAEAAGHLKPAGVLLLVHSGVCGERRTLQTLEGTGLETEIVLRHRGPLGPILRERRGWLQRQGLLDGDHEEMLVIRARAPQTELLAPELMRGGQDFGPQRAGTALGG